MSDMNETDSDSLLDQADALMRRRNFAANLNPAESKPGVNTAAVEETLALDSIELPADAADADADIDIPVLTEVVATSNLNSASLSTSDQDIQQVLESWLAETLPQVVAHSMASLSEHLLAELRERAHAELAGKLHLSGLTPPADS